MSAAISPQLHTNMYAAHQAYERKFYTATIDSLSLLGELDALMKLEDYNDFQLRPTPHAYENALNYLEHVLIKRTLPKPEFTPDGEGGLDIEWEVGGRHLALSLRAREGERDFISWREPNEQYDGQVANSVLFDDRLDWLLH